MRTLYLDCSMGIAGDMLMSALLELVPDKNVFLNKMNTIGIPNVMISAEESIKCGITGTHVQVLIKGEEEHSQDMDHDEHHHPTHPESLNEHTYHEHKHDEYKHDEHKRDEHTHDEHKHDEHKHDENTYHEHRYDENMNHENMKHENMKHENMKHENINHDNMHHRNKHDKNTHHHTSMPDICEIVSNLKIPEVVKRDVIAIYQIIAEAESKVHGKKVSEVHFHEVGMMDAIADITGCALLIHELSIDKIISSPVNVGFGRVKCSHGILPVPAPATANILIGIPCYAGNIKGELCTPTGAALLKYFVSKFSNMPPMTIVKIGYGMGKKDFEAANCVRAIMGETDKKSDEIIELSCNMDDMTAEEIGYAMEVLLKNGALDVFTTPIGMKKSRPGILFSVLCKEENKERMANLMFYHTTTIGIREYRCNRMIMERVERIIDSSFGQIRVKESSAYGLKKEKLEYEDLRKVAEDTGRSILEIKEMIKYSKEAD
ncbi:MAG: nickel pincer cofactor biosynthesis protein LarC [Mobilitalea sp.]